MRLAIVPASSVHFPSFSAMFKHPRPILIVDDDVELVTLLVDYLQLEGFAPTAAHNGDEALELLDKGEFEIMVLDVMMPGKSGIEVLKEVREKSSIPILMLTARGDPIDRIVGLELGADDYVAKPCSPRELAARLNAILRRTANTPAAIAPVIAGPINLDPTQRSVCINGEPIDLTGTEFTLLEVLVRKTGKPVPKDEIYQKVLGRVMQRYDRAIDVHVSALRHKLAAVLGKRVSIESIRGIGYQLILRKDEGETF